MHLAILVALIGSLTIDAALAVTPRPASSPRAVVADPITQLVERLSASHGLWRNGLFPSLGLTENASSEQIVARVLELSTFDKGRVTKHRIMQTRRVQIPGEQQELYTAILVETNIGRKVVLLKFSGPAAGWWSRVYAADVA
jgi:hypothetical protein